MGFFDQGVCSKHGQIKYADGRIFIGDIRHDLPNGRGVMVYPDQEKETGIFTDGVLSEVLVETQIKYEDK